MNSIAIWWPKDTIYPMEVHADINVWIDPAPKRNYIEFGFKVSKQQNTKELFIFLPFIVTRDEITNKIGKLSSLPLTNALFNERMKITCNNGGFHTVEYSSGNKIGDSFRYCQLSADDDIKVSPVKDDDSGKVDGTILTIKLKKSDGNIPDYYRLRVRNKIKRLRETTNENIFILDGLFKTVSFIELCINSTRKLPDQVCDRLTLNQTISSMNLFILTDTFTSYMYESHSAQATRMLEKHIWNEYLGMKPPWFTQLTNWLRGFVRLEPKIGNVIANHWREKNFHEFNLFVKVKYLKVSWWAPLFVTSILILFGVTSSVIGTKATEDYLPSLSQYIETFSLDTPAEAATDSEANDETTNN